IPSVAIRRLLSVMRPESVCVCTACPDLTPCRHCLSALANWSTRVYILLPVCRPSHRPTGEADQRPASRWTDSPVQSSPLSDCLLEPVLFSAVQLARLPALSPPILTTLFSHRALWR